MEALLGDLYGPRLAVREGWVPGEALASSHRYRSSAVGAPPPPRWLTSYALDVVALADGSWRVVRDLTDTPTGIGYALLDRSVMGRVAAEVLGPDGTGDLASISGFPASCVTPWPASRPSPAPASCCSPAGSTTPAYVEHSSLARLLGFHLVEGPDLVVRAGRLWLRTLGGLDPVDVVYRRFPDLGSIRSTAVRRAAAASRRCSAGRRGRRRAGQRPRRGRARGRRAGAVLAGRGGRPDRHHARPRRPSATTALLRQPVVDHGDERTLGSAAVVVRLHAVAGPDGVRVMPGGNGRVLADGDDPRRPTARLAKDVWVLAPAGWRAVAIAPALPQVDLSASVPDPRRRRAVLAGAGGRAGRGDRPDGARRRRLAPAGPVAGRARRRPLGDAGGGGAARRPWGPERRRPRRRRRARRAGPGRRRRAGGCRRRRRRPPQRPAGRGDRQSASTSRPRRGGCSSRLAARRAELETARRRSTPSTPCSPTWPRWPACGTRARCAGRRGASATSGRRVERALVVLELVGVVPARPRAAVDLVRPGRRRRHDGAGGAAGRQREPRRLPPPPPQRRRAGGGGRAAAARRGQPPLVRCRRCGASRTTPAPSGGTTARRAAGAMRAAVAGDRPVARIDAACDVVHDFAASVNERWFATRSIRSSSTGSWPERRSAARPAWPRSAVRHRTSTTTRRP